MSYDATFFDDVRDGAARSAAAIVPIVLALVPARSVVDVGCGDGTWLSAFAAAGVPDILGIDGASAEARHLAIPADRFQERDLAAPLAIRRRFDLAVCLEVGEHLPDAAAPTLVDSLVRLAPVVLFSAAVPHQTGNHHVNERWPEYWAQAFAVHGYRPADAIRPAVWTDERVEWWYAQNAFLYVSTEAAERAPALSAAVAATDPASLTRIHPRNYARLGDLLAEKARRRNRLTRRLVRFLTGRSRS